MPDKTSVWLFAFLLFLLTSAGARAALPRALFVFDTGERQLTVDGGHTAEVEADGLPDWVESEIGTAVALEGDNDKISFSPSVFTPAQGAVRIELRPGEMTATSQYIFRIYHPKGDGLTVYHKEGELYLRYLNRATGQSLGTRLPAAAFPMGQWSTVTVSWDFAEKRRVLLRVGEKHRALLTLKEGVVVEFDPGSKVLVGNEHAGKALFRGAIRSVAFFDTFLEADGLASVREKAAIPKATRARVLPSTLFFSRSQPKYDLHTNTLLRRWVDRPLFFDRRTVESVAPYKIVSSASFFKEQESVRAYGLDGFGSLVGSLPTQGTAFLEMLDYAESEPGRSLPLVMETASMEDAVTLEARLANFMPLARRAAASSQVLKVGEKVLVLSYAVDASPLDYWKTFCNTVREKEGDHFLFIADITVWRPRLLKEFHELGGLSAETLEGFRQHLRRWLDVSDGLMWAGGSHTNRPDGTFSREFYRDVLLPVLAGIFNEPPYRGKLLGLDAEVGYINVMTSRRSNWEEGTSRLRDGLALVREVNPDFVTMPEWNELNENTSVSPTLTNSLTTQRLVRFMKKRFGGEVPPWPGEAGAAPNLVISFRPYVKLGEAVSLEVLNIPDPGATGGMRVELALRGAAGAIVKRFEPVTLAADALAAHRFSFASEDLAAEVFVAPVLKVTAPDGTVSEWEEGLESMRFMPTWNLNDKETKIALRDLLRPRDARFSVAGKPGVGREVHVQGMIECDEPIASVEVVQGARELYAVAGEGELTPGEGEILVLLQWQSMRNPRHFDGSIGLDGSQWRMFRQWERPEYKREEYRLYEKGQRVVFETGPGVNATNARGGFFVIPAWQKASLWLKAPGVDITFPLAQVVAEGAMAKVLPDGLTVEAHHLQLLPEVPYPLLKKKVDFDAVVHPQEVDAPLQMRVVTVSGKIYRSPLRSLRSLRQDGGPARELAVWSATRGGPVAVSLPQDRLPDLEARLTPAMGAFLKVSEENDLFRGYIGGVPFDMGAFAKRHLATAYPGRAHQTAPSWEQEGGERLLRFDGKGNFLYFPEETLPRGSFTLEFEIKPTALERPFVLCTQRGYARGALTMQVVGGELQGEWIDGAGVLTPFRTGLRLPLNEWSRVSVTHDFKALRVDVNGGQYALPVENGVSKAVAPFIFGGYGNGKALGYFEGFLRALRIRHDAL